MWDAGCGASTTRTGAQVSDMEWDMYMNDRSCRMGLGLQGYRVGSRNFEKCTCVCDVHPSGVRIPPEVREEGGGGRDTKEGMVYQ